MRKKKDNIFSLSLHFKDSYITAVVFPLITVELLICTLLYGGVNNGTIDASLAIIFTIISTIFVGTVIMLFVLHNLSDIVKKEKEKEIHNCAHCSMDYKKYTFLRHSLISLDNLIAREKKLAYHPNPTQCKVYNYTTLQDTFVDSDENIKPENKIENIIKTNRKAGVAYRVFYLDNNFLNVDNRNQEIYGKENLIPSDQPRFFSNSQFDYVVHITPEDVKGYAAVCFISKTERCGDCAHAATGCDYKNDGTVYRILSTEETNYVLKRLNALIPPTQAGGNKS